MEELVKSVLNKEIKIDTQIDNTFNITIDEAKALNSLLCLHNGLFREMPEYIHLLRLINGLGTFLDQYDK